MTIAVLPVPAEQTSGFGMVRLDDDGRVIGFVEKPQDRRAAGTDAHPGRAGCSAAAFSSRRPQLPGQHGHLPVQTRSPLRPAQRPPAGTDFGKEIFPRSIRTHRVQAHLFDGYWEDLGTIKAYHEANLALAGDDPPFDFHSPEGVIYTRMRFLPASRRQRAPGWSNAW